MVRIVKSSFYRYVSWSYQKWTIITIPWGTQSPSINSLCFTRRQLLALNTFIVNFRHKNRFSRPFTCTFKPKSCKTTTMHIIISTMPRWCLQNCCPCKVVRGIICEALRSRSVVTPKPLINTVKQVFREAVPRVG